MEKWKEIEVVSPPSRWKTLLRHYFEKVLLRDVEAQDCFIPTVVVGRPPQTRAQKFPIFIVGISIVQVMLMYEVNYYELYLLFGYDPQRLQELWRLVTIMLVHDYDYGYFHLWSNVIMQLIIGIPLEIFHHCNRIAIIYLASVVGGSLFISVLSPRTYAVGASAALYGLLFSHFSTLILNWNEMDRKCCRLFWLLAYILFDISSCICGELEGKKDGSNISYVGHLGGATTGFLVSILVLKNFRSDPWVEKMQKIGSKIFIVLGVIIFFN